MKYYYFVRACNPFFFFPRIFQRSACYYNIMGISLAHSVQSVDDFFPRCCRVGFGRGCAPRLYITRAPRIYRYIIQCHACAWCIVRAIRVMNTNSVIIFVISTIYDLFVRGETDGRRRRKPVSSAAREIIILYYIIIHYIMCARPLTAAAAAICINMRRHISTCTRRSATTIIIIVSLNISVGLWTISRDFVYPHNIVYIIIIMIIITLRATAETCRARRSKTTIAAGSRQSKQYYFTLAQYTYHFTRVNPCPRKRRQYSIYL